MSEQRIDLEKAKELAEDLSRTLSQVPGSDGKLIELREEVDALREVLNGPEAEHFWITDRLRKIEAAFERVAIEVLADGVKAGEYIAEIGRIIGVR
ncbi:MAG: hypothetical protein ACKVQK_20525 [Burkholderiales bacterium]